MVPKWSTRKDAQDAGEMVTITTHNAGVFQSNSSCDSLRSPGQGGADSSSRGSCEQETQSRAVHVEAAIQVGAASETQLRAVRVH